MQAKLWKCRICSQSMISSGRPGVCPFCGAHERYMIPAERWNSLKEGDPGRLQSRGEMTLSQKSRKNVEAALELEKSNTSFYLCVSRSSKNPFIRDMFRALARVESEHVGIFTRILESAGKACPEQPCMPADRESVKESLDREIRAVASYGKFLGETKEPGLREIFRALVEIEGDHIQLDRLVLARMDKG